MTDGAHYFRYAPLELVERLLAQGWLPEGNGPLHSPHGHYSIFMIWPGPGVPPSPPARKQDGDIMTPVDDDGERQNGQR